MAGRIRACLLQVLRPYKVVEIQEEPETGAALQQVRGAQRVENIKSSQKEELKSCSCLVNNEINYVKKTPYLFIYLLIRWF